MSTTPQSTTTAVAATDAQAPAQASGTAIPSAAQLRRQKTKKQPSPAEIELQKKRTRAFNAFLRARVNELVKATNGPVEQLDQGVFRDTSCREIRLAVKLNLGLDLETKLPILDWEGNDLGLAPQSRLDVYRQRDGDGHSIILKLLRDRLKHEGFNWTGIYFEPMDRAECEFQRQKLALDRQRTKANKAKAEAAKLGKKAPFVKFIKPEQPDPKRFLVVDEYGRVACDDEGRPLMIDPFTRAHDFMLVAKRPYSQRVGGKVRLSDALSARDILAKEHAVREAALRAEQAEAEQVQIERLAALDALLAKHGMSRTTTTTTAAGAGAAGAASGLVGTKA